MKLYLIGLPGSGKSFLGKQLAGGMNLPFIDLDQIIEQEAGKPVSVIFSEMGEAYFRNLEAVALRQQSKTPDFVMACGGGTPCFHDNMKFINETGVSVFIDTPVPEIAVRLNNPEKQIRPLIAKAGTGSLEEGLHELLKERRPFYTQATLIVQDARSAADIQRVLKS